MKIYRTEKGEQAIKNSYLNALKDWPVPAEHITISTRYGDTFIIASGPKDAEPVLLLHGSGTNSVIWMDDVKKWSQNHRVYAIDLIGEPTLSDPQRPDVNSTAYIEWMNDIYNGLGLQRASLVGISLGGWLSLSYACSEPSRVNKLVLLCPAGIAPSRKGFMLKTLFYMPFGDWGKRQIINLVSYPNELPSEMMEFMLLIFNNFIYRRDDIPKISDKSLQKLNMPIKLYFGKQDALLDGPASCERFAAIVKHADIELLDNAGHTIIKKTNEIQEFLG